MAFMAVILGLGLGSHFTYFLRLGSGSKTHVTARPDKLFRQTGHELGFRDPVPRRRVSTYLWAPEKESNPKP